MAERLVTTLANGLTLLIEPLNRPVAAGYLVMPSGAACDGAGAAGAASLLHAWCQRGAGARSTRELNEALEDLGAQRGGGVGRQSTSWSVSSLAADFADVLPLLADTVLAPRFPQDELESCRQLALSEISGLDDNPGQRLMVELTRSYFPGDFGRPLIGDATTVAGLTPDGLREAWQSSYRPDGAVLALAGGLEPRATAELVERLLGEWSGASAAGAQPEPRTESYYDHVTLPTEQVHLGLVRAEVPPQDPQRYESAMASAVLSGGMGARLFTEVREKRGLCYGVGASLLHLRQLSYLLVRASTTTERSSQTLEVLAAELDRLAGTVTAEEVERARVGLLSSEVMGQESTPARAARAASDWFALGRVRSTDEVRSALEAVSAASVNDYLQRHRPSGYTTVSLGQSFEWPSGLTL